MRAIWQSYEESNLEIDVAVVYDNHLAVGTTAYDLSFARTANNTLLPLELLSSVYEYLAPQQHLFPLSMRLSFRSFPAGTCAFDN